MSNEPTKSPQPMLISLGGPLDTQALDLLSKYRPLPKIVSVHVGPTADDSAANSEFTEDLFFALGASGGTHFAPACELVDKIARENLGAAYDRYAFTITDGEPDGS